MLLLKELMGYMLLREGTPDKFMEVVQLAIVFKIALVLMLTTEEVEVRLRNDGVKDWFTTVTVTGVDTADFMLLLTTNDDSA